MIILAGAENCKSFIDALEDFLNTSSFYDLRLKGKKVKISGKRLNFLEDGLNTEKSFLSHITLGNHKLTKLKISRKNFN